MLAVAGMALPPLAVRKPAAPTAHRLPEDEMPKPAMPTALLSLLSCVVKSSCDVEDATTTQMELAKLIRVPVIERPHFSWSASRAALVLSSREHCETAGKCRQRGACRGREGRSRTSFFSPLAAPASYAGRARRRACERRAAAAGWHVPAEPTMPRLNSQVLGF